MAGDTPDERVSVISPMLSADAIATELARWTLVTPAVQGEVTRTWGEEPSAGRSLARRLAGVGEGGEVWSEAHERFLVVRLALELGGEMRPNMTLLPGRGRSSVEIMFVVNGVPCASCGGRGLGRYSQDVRGGTVTGTCGSCGAARGFRFVPVVAETSPPPYHLGPADTVTTMLTARELRAIADDALGRVPDDPTSCETVETYKQARRALVRGLTALVELSKLDRTALDLDAEQRAVEAHLRAYQAAEPEVEARPGAHSPARGLAERLRQHRAWLARGRVGDGRLRLDGERWTGFAIGYPRLAYAQLRHTEFLGMELRHAELSSADLDHVRFIDCALTYLVLRDARLTDVDMRGSRLGLAEVLGCAIERGDWQALSAARAVWGSRFVDVDLRDADLRDGIFTRARFERCDLRRADLRYEATSLPALGRAQEVTFVDCDLRGASLDGLRLTEVRFERCKLAGLNGKPVVLTGVTAVDCDLSPDGDGALGGGEQLLALWRARSDG